MLDECPLSPPAQAIARGLCRHLAQAGFSTLTELILPSGRRVDVIGVDRGGRIVVVEIKSCLEDYRSDRKWQEYREHCDRFYFAVAETFPRDLIPTGCGLFVADAYGAAMLRDCADVPINGSRRRALLLRFATIAADRLRGLTDPDPATL